MGTSQSTSNSTPEHTYRPTPFWTDGASSNVDPLTQRVLPYRPEAKVPRTVRTGQVQSVKFNVSTDPRGDIDHLVGYHMPDSSADPRAFGALQDRQKLAAVYDDDRVRHIPAK